MNDLEKARQEISEIDSKMAELFELRMQQSKKVACYKKEHGLSVLDAARETDLINKNRAYIRDGEVESYYVQFLKNTMALSRSYQTRLIDGRRVAYSGVPGAFAYIAAKNLIPEGEYIACKSFTDAYRGVENGDYDCAVLPIENSAAGEVGEVMDLIFSGNLYINQVVEQPVRHNLIAKPGAKIGDIKKVISHPQALSQCSDFIHRHGFGTQNYSNTAAAAEYVSSCDDASVAAIASDETARLYGLEIVETAVNDVQNNVTRFAVVSRVQNKPELKGAMREDENFIIVFTVQNKAGALAQTLNIIGAHGYNMKSLRSRPMKDLQWSYYFYIEAEGDVNNLNGREMMQELSALCARLKLVGTYCNGSK